VKLLLLSNTLSKNINGQPLIICGENVIFGVLTNTESMKDYNIEIIEYSPDKAEEWDDFVVNSNNGTIFQQQKFLSYHTPNKFDFTHYMFYENDKLVAVLPGGYKENGSVYWSPIGSSYGALVTNNVSFALAMAIVDAMIKFFKDRGTKEIFLIPPPLIYSKVFNQNIEYAMLYRNFGFEYHYISNAIDLTDETLIHYQNKRMQRKLKSAKNNPDLKLVEMDTFDEFYPILVKNKLKHNATPTHSLQDLITLKKSYPEQIRQFNVYYKGKAISGSTMFIANSQVSLCFYNMVDYDYEHIAPSHLSIDNVIGWSRKNEYKWFDFGVSQDTTSDNPMTPSMSLIHFKELFNTRGIFRSTYHLKLD
jgi:hypothetical protein